MRTLRMTVVASAVLLAACSSGGDEPAASDDSAPVTEPAATEPASTEPASSEPAVTEPASTEPATTEPASTEPASTEPVGTEADGDTGEADGAGSDDEAGEGDAPLVIDGPAEVRESCSSLPTGVTDFTLDAGGYEHDVRIYVPESLEVDPAPTVLNWHGLGSNGPEQAAFTGYETLADQEGFIVVHPTGVDVLGDGRNSWELTQFDTPDRDDLAFADALIDTVIADWCADPARIYSTGMSNGGFFTAELVCNRSDRIAAAVSVAGTSHPESCEPERAVPYIAYHGTADDVVPFEGGDSVLADDAGAAVGDASFFDQVMPAEFEEFAADAGCDLEPERTELTDEVIRFDYDGCTNDVPLTFYEIVGGGHTWPSSPLSEVLAGFGLFTQDVDATADAWEFMSQFTL